MLAHPRQQVFADLQISILRLAASLRWINYVFKDILPPMAASKSVIYRLKQVDFNGKWDYSHLIILYDKFQSSKIFVFPNPGSKIFHIGIDFHSGENFYLRMFDEFGKEVLAGRIDNSISKFNTEKLANGMYFITIYADETPVYNQKWFKE